MVLLVMSNLNLMNSITEISTFSRKFNPGFASNMSMTGAKELNVKGCAIVHPTFWPQVKKMKLLPIQYLDSSIYTALPFFDSFHHH